MVKNVNHIEQRVFICLSGTGLKLRSHNKLALGNGFAPDATSRQNGDAPIQFKETSKYLVFPNLNRSSSYFRMGKRESAMPDFFRELLFFDSIKNTLTMMLLN
jgi:hypothetical protein